MRPLIMPHLGRSTVLQPRLITMSSVQQLLTAIDAVKSANPQAKVTVTVLPSQVTRKRKSLI